MADKPSKLKIADREFTSRLIVGTGKFASNELMRDALFASGTELVTVALRRADISGKHDFLRTFSILSIRNVFFFCQTPAVRAMRMRPCVSRDWPQVQACRHGSNSRFTRTRVICFPMRSRRWRLRKFW